MRKDETQGNVLNRSKKEKVLVELVLTEHSYLEMVNFFNELVHISDKDGAIINTFAETEKRLYQDLAASKMGIKQSSPLCVEKLNERLAKRHFKQLPTGPRGCVAINQITRSPEEPSESALEDAIIDAFLSKEMDSYLESIQLYAILFNTVTPYFTSAQAEKLNRLWAQSGNHYCLADYAITSVQRVMRYSLLLQEVLGRTPKEDAVRCKRITQAITKVKKFTDMANNSDHPPLAITRVLLALNTQSLKIAEAIKRVRDDNERDLFQQMLALLHRQLIALVPQRPDTDEATYQKQQYPRVTAELKILGKQFDDLAAQVGLTIDQSQKSYISKQLDLYTDERIITLNNNMADLSKLSKHKDSDQDVKSLSFWEKRKRKQNAKKMAFLKNLSEVTLDLNKFKLNETKSYVPAISAIDIKWGKYKTKKLYTQKGLAVLGFERKFTALHDNIDSIKRNQGDIEALEGLLARLYANRSFKRQYSTFKQVENQLKQRIAKVKATQRKSINILKNSQDACLSKEIQLAMIERARQDMQRTLATPTHVLPIANANIDDNSIMARKYLSFRNYADTINTMIRVKSDLVNQEQNKDMLWRDLQAYNVGKKSVRAVKKSYNKYVKNCQDEIVLANSTIWFIPAQIQTYCNHALTTLDTQWSFKAHPRATALLQVHDMVTMLRDTAALMEYMADAQNALAQQDNGFNLYDINPIYQALVGVLSSDNANLTDLYELGAKKEKVKGDMDFRKQLNHLIHRKDFNKLPNNMKSKIVELNKFIKQNFEIHKQPWYSIFRFGKKKSETNMFAHSNVQTNANVNVNANVRPVGKQWPQASHDQLNHVNNVRSINDASNDVFYRINAGKKGNPSSF